MNMMKKVLSVVLSVLVIMSFASFGMLASAEEVAADGVSAVRWFPVPEERQNDEAWEVECEREGCLCQRFNQTAEDTGYSNYLDTSYTENGGLTITRNGNDGVDGNYWPRIRTVFLETSPEFDLKTANTLYFDFTVAEGTQWNLMITINGINIKLSKVISDAVGVSGIANSDADGIAGEYKGSINIQDAIEELSKESGTESATNAMALKNMKKTFIPQINMFCVGPVGATLTINELYIATPENTTGEGATFVDMGVLTGFGDEWYEMDEGDEGAADEGNTDEGNTDEGNTDEGNADEGNTDEGNTDEGSTTTTTKAQEKDDKDDKDNGGLGIGVIILIVVAVVAVIAVAAVVVIILMKKKG